MNRATDFSESDCPQLAENGLPFWLGKPMFGHLMMRLDGFRGVWTSQKLRSLPRVARDSATKLALAEQTRQRARL